VAESRPVLSPAAIAELHQGHKIAAIKQVRADLGLDLKSAKDTVDAYIRSQPLLHQAYTERQAQARRTALRWLALIAAVVAIAAWYFLGASAH
jgi:ribosomal protein L7/L12